MLDIIKGLFILLFTITGVVTGYHIAVVNHDVISNQLGEFVGATPGLAVSSIFGLSSYLLASILWREFQIWITTKLEGMSPVTTLYGILGFILGLAMANLVIFLPVFLIITYNKEFFSKLTEEYELLSTLVPLYYFFIPIIINLFFGYLGARIVYNYNSRGDTAVTVKIVDTSALIDSRICGLIETGFLEGKLIVPGCVLTELQYMADEAESDKRSRAREALNLLNRLKGDRKVIIEITAFDEIQKEVDEKLVTICRDKKAALVTIDYNLAKVASLKGVKVLNVHELALAVKTSILPGENLEIEILKKGKNKNQGIGYLTDGTMVVVEEGDQKIGESVKVSVTKVLQTSAGKMIFTKMS